MTRYPSHMNGWVGGWVGGGINDSTHVEPDRYMLLYICRHLTPARKEWHIFTSF